MSSRHMIGRNMAIVMCLLAPFFSYAQAYVSLGEAISSAPAISDTAWAAVSDGADNYFMIEAAHLPATVYYIPDSAYGPVPELISVIENDTLPAVMVSERCHMAWRWELAAVASEEEQPIRYFTFSAHENNAIAALCPTVCQPIEIALPDTAVCALDETPYFVWGDLEINTSGTYTRHLYTAAGCDSMVTRTVTVLEQTHGTAAVTAYDSCVWADGYTYRKSGRGYITYLTNMAGCDSVVTLDLTIRHLVADTLRETVCSNQLPYQWQGQSYTVGNTYSTDTVHGPEVDKVFMDTVHTLVLTVSETSGSEFDHTACDSYTWNNVTYTQSGTHTVTMTNAAGCDSVVTLRLTVNYSSTGEETRTAYESYDWHGETYTESGTYTFTMTNAAGCDSVITLNLTIKDRPVYAYDTAYFCPGINTEHDEPLDDTRAVRYLPYVYEAPAAWYKAGMVVEELSYGMMLNLSRAERNLRQHYVGNLEPVEQIAWSYRAHKTAAYAPVVVEQEPQWLGTGDLMLNVYFLCGHEYRELLTIGNTEDVEMVEEQSEARKVLMDGQLYIIRGNERYTIFGTRVR